MKQGAVEILHDVKVSTWVGDGYEITLGRDGVWTSELAVYFLTRLLDYMPITTASWSVDQADLSLFVGPNAPARPTAQILKTNMLSVRAAPLPPPVTHIGTLLAHIRPVTSSSSVARACAGPVWQGARPRTCALDGCRARPADVLHQGPPPQPARHGALGLDLRPRRAPTQLERPTPPNPAQPDLT